MLDFFNDRYMEDALDTGTVPRIAPDGSRVYGYAVEHHTVELYMRLWKAHNDDVIAQGTPPPSARLLPLMASTWNKFMGGVDTVRKVLSGHASKYALMKPSSLVWMVFFNYLLYNAFRSYQLCRMIVGQVATYAQFAKLRKDVCTYGDFLYDLGMKISTAKLLKRRPEFARVPRVASPILGEGEGGGASPRQTASHADEPTATRPGPPKNKLLFVANSDLQVANRRLSGGHVAVSHPPRSNFSCVLCCVRCKKGEAHDLRRGSESQRYCATCSATLCTKKKNGYADSCWNLWHTMNQLEIPGCMNVPPNFQYTLPADRTATRARASTRRENSQPARSRAAGAANETPQGRVKKRLRLGYATPPSS
jgi:hypothetical protein